MFKKLNVIVGSIYLISAKLKAGSRIAVVSLTDFSQDFRLIFDLEKKDFLAPELDLKLSVKEKEMIAGLIEGK